MIDNQTIVYVLSESLLTIKNWRGKFIRNLYPKKIQEIKTKRGENKQSDGYGGGTANMEFQTLTGYFYNINLMVSVILRGCF